MSLKKTRDIFLLIIISFILILSPCIYSCKNKSNSLPSEHTQSINNNPVFIQIFSSEAIDKKIAIIVLAKEDENVEELKLIFDEFLKEGYKVAFLLGDWLSILQKYQDSSNEYNYTNSFCNDLDTICNQEKKIILLSGEMGCFASYKALQSTCIEGLILLSPYCKQKDFQQNNSQFSFYIPTFISVGENDENSFKFSLQLYQSNRSFCEMRTYPTDETSFNLLKSFNHLKEQIKLWIETIMTRKN